MSVQFRFADFWRQNDLPDVDVIISCNGLDLGKLPGHGVILSHSPFFKAQLLRWQQQCCTSSGNAADANGQNDNHRPSKEDGGNQEGADAAAAAADNQDVPMLPAEGAATAAGSSKPRLVLTLQHADHQPAALAVLQSLYAVKPIPQLLSELPQEQQLHAALLADVWQLPEVSTAAVQALVHSYESGSGLSAAAHDQFLQLEAMPSFLLPLTQKVLAGLAQQQTKAAKVTLRRMLLFVLGDLEEVWADPALRDTLMGLPLPAVATLLRSDHLKVASEDNVLYTAQAYLDGVSDLQERQAAQQLLARLVRAQHLSHFWLSAAALSMQAPSLLVATYQKQLRRLLLLKSGTAGSITVGMETSELQKLIPGAPCSWVLGQRALRPAPEISLRWELPVSKLMSTAQLSATQKQQISLDSPVQTPPMNGVSFGVLIQADWQSNAQGSLIGVYAKPKDMPSGSYLSFDVDFGVEGVRQIPLTCPVTMNGNGWGQWDFFSMGTMAGGWDAAAWARQGLPAEGNLIFTLRVHKVADATCTG